MDIIEKIPTNLDDAIEILLQYEGVYEAFTKYGPDYFHSTIGRDIRNNWGLWKGAGACRVSEAPLYYWFYARGFVHPDDISGTILDALYLWITEEKEIDLVERAAFYEEYWKNPDSEEWGNIIRKVELVIEKYNG